MNRIDFPLSIDYSVLFFINCLSAPDVQWLIAEIIVKKPLNLEQIAKLQPYVPHYIIPRNQNNSQSYGLVLYCDQNRPGALGEADLLSSALRQAGFVTVQKEWDSLVHLLSLLHVLLSERQERCACLFLCIMGHGYSGGLADGYGNLISINDILSRLGLFMPESRPLVSISHIYRHLALILFSDT